jgi:hypothetical protein
VQVISEALGAYPLLCAVSLIFIHTSMERRSAAVAMRSRKSVEAALVAFLRNSLLRQSQIFGGSSPLRCGWVGKRPLNHSYPAACGGIC